MSDFNRFPTKSRGFNALAVPVAFALAYFANAFAGTAILISHVLSTVVHEFGHATTAWMVGVFAVPVPILGFGLTFGGEQNPLFIALFSTALSYGVYQCCREKLWILAGLFLGGLALQLFMSFRLDEETRQMLFVFGGIGGQFYLSTLLVIGFYYPLPDFMRWDFCRLPALAFGSCCLVDICKLWMRATKDHRYLPMGSGNSGDPNDAGGDLNRLMHDFHWSVDDIIQRYWLIGMCCTGIIIAHYVWGVIYPGRRSESAAKATYGPALPPW